MDNKKNDQKHQKPEPADTEKKPINQNQTHNSIREGMGPNTKRKPG